MPNAITDYPLMTESESPSSTTLIFTPHMTVRPRCLPETRGQSGWDQWLPGLVPLPRDSRCMNMCSRRLSHWSASSAVQTKRLLQRQCTIPTQPCPQSVQGCRGGARPDSFYPCVHTPHTPVTSSSRHCRISQRDPVSKELDSLTARAHDEYLRYLYMLFRPSRNTTLICGTLRAWHLQPTLTLILTLTEGIFSNMSPVKIRDACEMSTVFQRNCKRRRRPSRSPSFGP